MVIPRKRKAARMGSVLGNAARMARHRTRLSGIADSVSARLLRDREKDRRKGVFRTVREGSPAGKVQGRGAAASVGLMVVAVQKLEANFVTASSLVMSMSICLVMMSRRPS